ncbi:hypothetical protein LOK49_LG11G00219 [Camellia lanceoleosa]|uniref:Uncharacterized protein n=1 Tax=Camellia lanceoleosa TaxID=1840588 RepID=A0ACC0FY04_9ERIC|nr:hypothetical protein LOK49_LG11G00219 [Camellia lanceoleosa]
MEVINTGIKVVCNGWHYCAWMGESLCAEDFATVMCGKWGTDNFRSIPLEISSAGAKLSPAKKDDVEANDEVEMPTEHGGDQSGRTACWNSISAVAKSLCDVGIERKARFPTSLGSIRFAK